MKNIEKLKSILKMMPTAFYDDNTLRSALLRSFADDKRAGRILYVIAESGIVDNAKMVGMVDEKIFEKYINSIYDDYGIEKTLTKEYITYWLEALNIAYAEPSQKINETNTDDNKEETYSKEDNKFLIETSFNTLSLSEKKAAICVFSELGGMEGTVVGSRIADKYKITRSLIVSALRKLESAGLITSRSMGKSGTYVRIINRQILEIFADYAKQQSFIKSYLNR